MFVANHSSVGNLNRVEDFVGWMSRGAYPSGYVMRVMISSFLDGVNRLLSRSYAVIAERPGASDLEIGAAAAICARARVQTPYLLELGDQGAMLTTSTMDEHVAAMQRLLGGQ